MKIGVSTYSMEKLRKANRLDAFGLIDAAKEFGFASIEFTDIFAPEGTDREAHARELAAYAKDKDMKISSYTIGADLLASDGDAEIERLKDELKIAAALGADKLRHDICRGFPPEIRTKRNFDCALPIVAPRARRITEYAESLGIKTMFENHGFFCQDSDRVEKLINEVGSPNFGLLADIGNFLCVDEDPVKAIGKLSPYILHVHIKDFFVRSGMLPNPGAGWFKSRAGNFLRGTIVGHGDVPVKQCLELIRNSGYKGCFSIEFEGCEDNAFALKTGLENLSGYFKD